MRAWDALSTYLLACTCKPRLHSPLKWLARRSHRRRAEPDETPTAINKPGEPTTGRGAEVHCLTLCDVSIASAHPGQLELHGGATASKVLTPPTERKAGPAGDSGDDSDNEGVASNGRVDNVLQATDGHTQQANGSHPALDVERTVSFGVEAKNSSQNGADADDDSSGWSSDGDRHGRAVLLP